MVVLWMPQTPPRPWLLLQCQLCRGRAAGAPAALGLLGGCWRSPWPGLQTGTPRAGLPLSALPNKQALSAFPEQTHGCCSVSCGRGQSPAGLKHCWGRPWLSSAAVGLPHARPSAHRGCVSCPGDAPGQGIWSKQGS